MSRSFVIVIGILSGAVVLQVAALTWVVLRQEKIATELQQAKAQIRDWETQFLTTQGTPSTQIATDISSQRPITISPTATVTTNPAAIATVAATLTQLRSQIDDLQSTISSLQKTSAAKTSSTTTLLGSTEYILFMGSGSTTNRDWTTLPSTTLLVAPQNYGTLRDVRFEAGLAIEGGIAQARLIDTTTGAIFYDSTLQHDKGTALWKTSPSLILPSQAGTYAVQLRSSSGEIANLDGARIKLYIKK